MFHNYFFLKRLAHALDEELHGSVLEACFSQNKDELALAFSRETGDFFIRANLDPNISLLSFPDAFARAGKNSVDLFSNLLGKKVQSVAPFNYERSFHITFEGDHQLVFKMHARRANILHVINGQVEAIFRNTLGTDLDLDVSSLHKQYDITREQFEHHQHNPLDWIPALGKEVKIYLEKKDYPSKTANEKWELFQEVLRKLQENPIFLKSETKPKLDLLNAAEVSEDHPITAANWLYQQVARSYYMENERSKAINALKQKIKKSENYILKTQTKLHEIENARSPEEIANIIMANLHALQQGLSKAVLNDFYHNEPITVKLNTKLTPQKNAEVLYKKAKNRHQEIAILHKNIEEKKELIDTLSKQILDLYEVDSVKSLRSFLRKKENTKGKKQHKEQLPYHSFTVDGWEVLVGKNAKANDELTLKVARKNDLWLHAKDVAGSHVVVRQHPGQNFPNHIIEKAGALAAANSKRKTDTLCPVIYTQKKFVRKAKGAPAGQVIVEKEEIVMVEPSLEL